jgi:hypothetical protein
MHEEMHEGPEGELTVRAEKLDAGAVRILREWPNVSDECSPHLRLQSARESHGRTATDHANPREGQG